MSSLPQYVIKVGNRYLIDLRTFKPELADDIAGATRYPHSEAHVKANALKQRGYKSCVIEAR